MSQEPEGHRNLAVLVLSCDGYRDLWRPFLEAFRRHFPVAGRRIYVGSNEVACNLPGVTPVLSGKDVDWSSSYRKILSHIEERKLFVILEDLFLETPIQREGLAAALDYLLNKGAKHVKYWASPPPDEPTENDWIGVYPRGAPYRATVCGFWDRDYLMSLLIDGEDPWSFEILGSYRTSFSDGFYGLTRPLASYRNMVEKGCWIHESVEWAAQNGIALELDRRRMPGPMDRLAFRLKRAYFELVLRVPWRWRVAVMSRLRRAIVSY